MGKRAQRLARERGFVLGPPCPEPLAVLVWRVRYCPGAPYLTMLELAHYLGVSAETIHAWEHGVRVPRAGDVLALERLLSERLAVTLGRLGNAEAA